MDLLYRRSCLTFQCFVVPSVCEAPVVVGTGANINALCYKSCSGITGLILFPLRAGNNQNRSVGSVWIIKINITNPKQASCCLNCSSYVVKPEGWHCSEDTDRWNSEQWEIATALGLRDPTAIQLAGSCKGYIRNVWWQNDSCGKSFKANTVVKQIRLQCMNLHFEFRGNSAPWRQSLRHIMDMKIMGFHGRVIGWRDDYL